MAKIDPEMQRRLNAAASELVVGLNRLRDATTLARLELIELATAMDEDLSLSLEDAAVAAIQTAGGLRPTGGAR